MNKTRYSRNLNVENFTEEMQQRLFNSSVLVVGAGGLGSAVLSYLSMSGIGRIGVVEFDVVSESNLQRQILFSEEDLGRSKGAIAVETIRKKNSLCEALLYNTRFTHAEGLMIAKEYDVIVDCTDNYSARYAMDAVSKELGIPFVYGSAEQLHGQVSTFNHSGGGSYCDLYPEMPDSKEREILGVLSPIPGIVGSIQALEVIKLLSGMQNNLSGKLLMIDGTTYNTTIFNLQ